MPRRRDADAEAAFRQGVALAVLLAVAAVAVPLRAQPASDAPVRERPLGAPQVPGAVHTLRQIPEACTRLEGVFTGEASQPYRMRAVATSPACRPRARYQPADQADPAAASGWVLEDRIRVPEAACPSRRAVVEVWRLPGDAAPARDGQGRTRIYLEQARQRAAAGEAAALPRFTAKLAMEGAACPS